MKNLIYTRRGDQGETGLAGGIRIGKDKLRIEVLGDIDELNASLGLLLSETVPEPVATQLRHTQSLLFEMGAELSMPTQAARIQTADTQALETAIDHMQAKLTPLTRFILPAGNRSMALCHLCRTICRRCERHLVALGQHTTGENNEQAEINPDSLCFLNRLSDFLFVAARFTGYQQQQGEHYWQSRTN
ncbi:cob(I)yrinic acid a,c-diamide adenosyltransferase [Candidatus Venteria ishoeyi]|uniref:Corrinoid adenosyltransferase n=1 Tax=Candidatus Venteria ishoeyi TaxID=1899563 RepID=A0A1H6F7I2_9GAMM|nr:cob(I)yrinic acid a,c-diamide adenosyltransferase [Candidatus Venteria ishoeyi]SEH06092.1 Cob(I)yrinic acid a%2Cc-diamide adenosyltransferase [Candidatus Venteria ishoeyi]